MKRRILSIIIALGLSLGLLPGTAWAEEESSPVNIIFPFIFLLMKNQLCQYNQYP